METQEILLPSSKKHITVTIDRKQMKTCRLKVFPDMSVKVSTPQSTPSEWINAFLNEKSSWIEEKLEHFRKTTGYAATTQIRNGMSIKMLGEDLIFSVTQSDKNNLYQEGKVLHVCSTDINNQDKLLIQFENWWRNESLRIVSLQLDRLYPVIKKYGVDHPKVAIKKMKTLWGSCSVNRGVVTFNQYLIKAKPACIEYVVLHELVHFLYPNHSKKFYDFLSIYMPDWKERKKILDQDVVHGL